MLCSWSGGHRCTASTARGWAHGLTDCALNRCLPPQEHTIADYWEASLGPHPGDHSQHSILPHTVLPEELLAGGLLCQRLAAGEWVCGEGGGAAAGGWDAALPRVRLISGICGAWGVPGLCLISRPEPRQLSRTRHVPATAGRLGPEFGDAATNYPPYPLILPSPPCLAILASSGPILCVPDYTHRRRVPLSVGAHLDAASKQRLEVLAEGLLSGSIGMDAFLEAAIMLAGRDALVASIDLPGLKAQVSHTHRPCRPNPLA